MSGEKLLGGAGSSHLGYGNYYKWRWRSILLGYWCDEVGAGFKPAPCALRRKVSSARSAQMLIQSPTVPHAQKASSRHMLIGQVPPK